MGRLALVAEALYVFGAFLQRAARAALHLFADLLDDVGIGERGDVAGVHVIGNGGENAAHDFAGARFGHVWNDVDVFGAGDFADHGFDRGGDFVLYCFVGMDSWFERDVHDRHAALDFVDDGNNGGFRDFRQGEASGLEFFGAEAVAGDVDDVIDAAENAVVAVGGKNSAVGGVVRPIAPIFAMRILVVLFVVLIDEALRAAPDSLHDAGPGIANADISGRVQTRRNFLSFFIPNNRINAEGGRSSTAGLHGVERRFGAAEEAAGFGLPPGVDDDRLAFADDLVIPAPDVRFDGLAHGSHVLEVVVVFFWLVAAGFAQHANGGGRSVKDVDVEALCDAPGTTGVGKLRDAFVEDGSGGESQRAVDDVGVAGDPADVGHAPVNVFGMNVLVILRGARDVREIAASAMLAALGLASGAAGVHEEERGFGVLGDRLDEVIAIVLENIVDEEIALHNHRGFGAEVARVALPDENFVDGLAFFFCGFHGDVCVAFVIDPFSVAVVAVGVDQHAAAGIGGAQAASFATEAAEDDG